MGEISLTGPAPLEVLVEAVIILLAALLITGASTKLAPDSRFANTLSALGFQGSVLSPRVASKLLACSEILGFLCLTLVRGWVAAAWLVALGCTFGAAGLIALRRSISVPCNCFGTKYSHALGWRQVAATPLWFAAGGLLVNAASWDHTWEMRLLSAALAAGVAAARFIWILAPLWSRTVDRRLASTRGIG